MKWSWRQQDPLKIQWICAMLHGVGSQKTATFRVFFRFSMTPLPALCPTQLSVHCVQLFIVYNCSLMGNKAARAWISQIASVHCRVPKFIFNLSQDDFSIVRSTRSFRWKLRKKSLYGEVIIPHLYFVHWLNTPDLPTDYSSFCGRYRTCRYLLLTDWLKYPETLIPTSGFCKCGHENTGFDKLCQKASTFQENTCTMEYLFIVTSRLSRR